jgi:hypothetical protein
MIRGYLALLQDAAAHPDRPLTNLKKNGPHTEATGLTVTSINSVDSVDPV